MKWLSTLALIAALLAVPSAAQAAPPKPKLPACTPAQVASWPIVDENTVIEGRTIVVRQSPDGSRRCGEVQVSTQRPQAPRKVRK